MSTINENGTVKNYFGCTAFMMDAYSAQKFTANIVASNVLSGHVDVLMTSSPRPTKAWMLFKKGSLNMKGKYGKQPVKTVCTQVRIRLHLCLFYQSGTTTQRTSTEKWHDTVGHISSERY